MSAADFDVPCPLNRDSTEHIRARHAPVNAAVAHCYQLHDDLLAAWRLALAGNQPGWLEFVKLMRIHLESAERARADVKL